MRVAIILALLAIILALFAIILALFAGSAMAHQAPAGWEYDSTCCSNRDCEPVAEGVVREVAGGYSVTILPGQHKMVPAGAKPLVDMIPHNDPRIRVSGDSERHVCVWGNRILCIYIPPGGV